MDSNGPCAHGIRFRGRPLWSFPPGFTDRPAESSAAAGWPLTMVRHSSHRAWNHRQCFWCAWSHIRLVHDLQRGASEFDRPSSLAISVAAVMAALGWQWRFTFVSVREHRQAQLENIQEKSMTSIQRTDRNDTEPSISGPDGSKTGRNPAGKGESNCLSVIDHSGEAGKGWNANGGPTKLVIFGNPKAGTPLMIASPSIAIDLPLKVLGFGMGLPMARSGSRTTPQPTFRRGMVRHRTWSRIWRWWKSWPRRRLGKTMRREMLLNTGNAEWSKLTFRLTGDLSGPLSSGFGEFQPGVRKELTTGTIDERHFSHLRRWRTTWFPRCEAIKNTIDA